MKRRDFLKYSGIAGLGSVFPTLDLHAAHDGYAGPLWMTVDALGGWDPTSFCDPKGYTNPTDPLRVNNYPATAIQTIANSSLELAPPPDGYNVTVQPYQAIDFFTKYIDRLLVINGIDNNTASHRDGQRYNWTGELGRNGYPNIGALIAASLANTRAMPFLANRGYTSAAGLTTPVRITTSGLNALLEIAYPNRSGSAQNSTSPVYYADDVLNVIKTAVSENRNKLLSQQRLPRIRDAIQKLMAATNSTAHMSDLADFLEANPASRNLASFGRRQGYNMYVQGQIALAAYKTGVTASAHISMPSFDTHSAHDEKHYPLLLDLFEALDAILDEAKLPAYGLDDKIVLMMGSDFGRTNKYNDGNGKDHWPITSMMFMGDSQFPIAGNRVIGKTTDVHKAIKIDPITLEPDINDTNPNAIKLTPAHIHRAVRKLAGIENNAFSQQFNLKGSDINLFV